MRNGWVNRAAEHDSDLASRRREQTAKELERSQDDALILIRAALAKVAERIKGMDADELAAGQIPAALRTLIELEFKVLGYEDRVALTQGRRAGQDRRTAGRSKLSMSSSRPRKCETIAEAG